jgi:tryptophan-rich sensory protein
MLLIKIIFVFLILFLLSLVIYFFNLDMKAASLLIPFLTKIYDKREQKNKEQY